MKGVGGKISRVQRGLADGASRIQFQVLISLITLVIFVRVFKKMSALELVRLSISTFFMAKSQNVALSLPEVCLF